MKTILAFINVALLNYAKKAVLGFIEKKINEAVKNEKISSELGEKLTIKFGKELDKIFEKLDTLKTKVIENIQPKEEEIKDESSIMK